MLRRSRSSSPPTSPRRAWTCTSTTRCVYCQECKEGVDMYIHNQVRVLPGVLVIVHGFQSLHLYQHTQRTRVEPRSRRRNIPNRLTSVLVLKPPRTHPTQNQPTLDCESAMRVVLHHLNSACPLSFLNPKPGIRPKQNQPTQDCRSAMRVVLQHLNPACPLSFLNPKP